MTLITRPSGAVLSSVAAGDVFDTGARLLQQPNPPIVITAGGGSGLLPSGIVFTSPDAGYAYSYGGLLNGVGSSTTYLEGCLTTGRLLPQEWGPAGDGYYNGTTTVDGVTVNMHTFDDIDLGAAPSWANFCELTINLTQTPPVLPTGPYSAALFNPWPCEITNGADEDHEDGCCVVEAMSGLFRQFWVDIVGGRIVLRRQQSITDVTAIPTASGNPAYPGLLTHVIDAKAQNLNATSGNMNLGQSNACSIVNTADYTSTYTGTIAITIVNHRGP